MNERWVAVDGFVGLYEVSDRGQVRSMPREIVYSNLRVHRYRGQLLSTKPGSTGYPQVTLSEAGRSKHYWVHNLVARAFIGEPEQGQVVRHIDDVKTNNLLSNLAYGSPADNYADSIRNGCAKVSKERACPLGHALSGTNLRLRNNSHRSCLACSRARAWAREHPEDSRTIADIAQVYLEDQEAGVPPGRRPLAHCRHGHPLTEDNVRIIVRKSGSRRRVCKTCDARNGREWRRRRAAAQSSLTVRATS